MRTYTIGRGTGKDFYYANQEVSTNHAEIISDNGNYTLVDHSLNGTIVNGNRVHNSSYPLHRGDTVLFAGREMLDWNRIDPVAVTPPPTTKGTNVFAILGFIFAFVLSPLGIVFSAIGLGKAKKGYGQKGLAVAGLVVSIVFTAIWFITLLSIDTIGDAYDPFDSYYY